MRTWIVDGMNVVGSTPDGWWRDRRGAMRRLAERLGGFAADAGESVTVVFDGKPFDLDAAPAVVVFAPAPGPNAADDEIERIVAAHADPASVSVVTSDRDLVSRVQRHGAEVVGSRSFRRKLEQP
jgi:predicted RNA-binding protein with PIN domain